MRGIHNYIHESCCYSRAQPPHNRFFFLFFFSWSLQNNLQYIISLKDPGFWNQSPYCSFSQIHCRSVIAFTILLPLKLSLISTVQIEYCPLPAPVVNLWKRKRLNYPGDFTGSGAVALTLSRRHWYSAFIVLHGGCIMLSVSFRSTIAYFSTIDSFMTIWLVLIRVTMTWSLMATYNKCCAIHCYVVQTAKKKYDELMREEGIL